MELDGGLGRTILLMTQPVMTEELARRFAHSTLNHVSREFPHGLAYVMEHPEHLSPSGLHPVFYGSFDWHSCVHGWWQLLRIARLFPELSQEIYERAAETFTEEKLQIEFDFLEQNSGFERPYGWGWLLALHLEAAHQEFEWEPFLEPLARLLARRLSEYLPRLTYPVRAGTHANTAFALVLAFEWATNFDPTLQSTIRDWANEKFGQDLSAAHQEPSGEDFLSPTCTEALLMARTMEGEAFGLWFARFLPTLPENLLTPAVVGDRSDGRIGHLDGLNLSRAWCWRNLASYVPEHEDALTAASERLLRSALPHLEANYMSEHWLCSFALLALTDVAS